MNFKRKNLTPLTASPSQGYSYVCKAIERVTCVSRSTSNYICILYAKASSINASVRNPYTATRLKGGERSPPPPPKSLSCDAILIIHPPLVEGIILFEHLLNSTHLKRFFFFSLFLLRVLLYVRVKIFPILIVYIQFVHKKDEDRQSLFITREKTPALKKKMK